MKNKKITLLIPLIFIASVTLLFLLSLRLLSQYHYHKAKDYVEKRFYGLALRQVEKAGRFQPTDYKILKKNAEIYLVLGDISQDTKEKKFEPAEAFTWNLKAKDFYLRAFHYNHLDVETAFGLAVAETRLEQLYRYLYPRKNKNPYNPLPYYKKTLTLRPNGVMYNYTMARYLHRRGMEKELLVAVRTLGRIYPASFSQLKKERFWSEHVRAAFKKGLMDALNEKNSVKSAYRTLSAVMEEEKDWSASVSWYLKALNIRGFENSTHDYMLLGRLYLKNAQFNQAEEAFITAFNMSISPADTLERIYRLYKNEKLYEMFYQVFQKVETGIPVSPESIILKAQLLMELEKFKEAKDILADLGSSEQDAKAYYWLYRVAEIENDDDAMELAIQRATVLDPENTGYRKIFYNHLKKMRKFTTAEKELSRIIEITDPSKAGLYNERAWMKWNRQDYEAAISDWLVAASLQPEHPDYNSYIAEAYGRLSDFEKAAAFYKKALDLAPGNSHFKKKYSEITAKQTGLH